MIYLIVTILFLFLIYRYDYCRAQTGRLAWLIVMALFLIIIGGLRYRIGYDTPTYIRFYNNLNDLGNLTSNDLAESRFAPGFLLMASFCKLFTNEIILLQLVEASCICGVATWFFNRYTRNPFFALLLFFYIMYVFLVFEQIREGFAVAIFLLAYPSFVKRNWIIYYLLCFAALLFHTSAIIMFVVPLICIPGIRQLFVFGKRTFFICVGALIIGFVMQSMFFYYLEFISVTDAMSEFAERYTNTIWATGSLNITGIVGFLFRYIAYPLVGMGVLRYLYFRKGESYRFSNEESLALVSVYISILSVAISILLRFNNYFFFFCILIMSDFIFDYVKLLGKKVRLSYAYWMIFFLPLFAMQLYSYFGYINKSGTLKSYMAYYPYNSYIDKERDENREKTFQYQSRKRYNTR